MADEIEALIALAAKHSDKARSAAEIVKDNLAVAAERGVAGNITEAAAEIRKLRAALVACVDYWRDTEVPCPPALHDQVTTALGNEQRVTGD